MKYPTFGSMPPAPHTPTPRQVAELRRLLASHEKKAKASITLSGELLRAADVLAGASGRSALVERALRRHLRRVLSQYRRQHDIELIDANAAATNRESDMLLALQGWPE